jgi:hypothetical protein
MSMTVRQQPEQEIEDHAGQAGPDVFILRHGDAQPHIGALADRPDLREGADARDDACEHARPTSPTLQIAARQLSLVSR